MLRVLVACECSGAVRQAFRDLGHDAWSCDLKPAEDGSPYHLTGCALEAVADYGWDLLIAHPPCTYLCNSGVRWLHTEPGRWEAMEAGAAFFRQLLTADIAMVAVENPIQHRYARERVGADYTQIIHPWQHGHRAKKATCLWLRGLPPLVPSDDVGPPPKVMGPEERREWEYIHRLPRTADRGALRSVTFAGIAAAMAAQWGLIDEHGTTRLRTRDDGWG